MRQKRLGALGETSVLTLGGGGIGQLWGETTRAECVETVRLAVDQGIDLLDMAASYGDGEAEEVIGEAFEGRLPEGVRVTTKVRIGQTPAEEIEETIRNSLDQSLARMRIDQVDIFFLHSNVVPDNDPMSAHPSAPVRMTPYQNFITKVRPTFAALQREGKIKHWGLTGIGYPDTIMTLLAEKPGPSFVQCIANPIDSPGSLKFTPGPAKPREIMALAQSLNIGVMGIRAVQAGALTDAIDRPLPNDHEEVRDYNRAAGFRALAKSWGMTAADLGHLYALSMSDVDTVVLGIKNRQELQDCLKVADRPVLSVTEMTEVDASFA